MSDLQHIKKIAITMGDPGGLGPEVIVKALSDPEVMSICEPVVIGRADIIEDAVRLAGVDLEVRNISDISESRPEPGRIEVINVGAAGAIERGKPSADAGTAIVEYIKYAVGLALDKKVRAVVTAPISKESLRMAGHKWPGHTELLAELTGTDDFAMMFASDKLRVILCTIHVPLKDVPNIISQKLVLKTIRLARKGAAMLGIDSPRIGVAGLNPHAGESGIMGDEETEIIVPAIERAVEEGINAVGTLPPDVIFHKAYRGDFDMVVCMYHDQGLIPFKMLAFDTGVNMTVGLPIIRTSPDHGTGFDIAWKNLADRTSMAEAIKLAATVRLEP